MKFQIVAVSPSLALRKYVSAWLTARASIPGWNEREISRSKSGCSPRRPSHPTRTYVRTRLCLARQLCISVPPSRSEPRSSFVLSPRVVSAVSPFCGVRFAVLFSPLFGCRAKIHSWFSSVARQNTRDGGYTAPARVDQAGGGKTGYSGARSVTD